jgi:hypothetical protein
MNDLKASQLAKLAYIVAAIFTIHLITYLIPGIRDATPTSSAIVAELIGIVGVAEHLLLFPIVAALPAPRWARAAGYGWLVIDMATDIMQLNGVDKSIYLSLRYGGHISASLWIASASWQAKGTIRIVGWLLALDLFIYSFIAFIPFTFVVLFPSLVLLPVWFVLAGRFFTREDALRQVGSEKQIMI